MFKDARNVLKARSDELDIMISNLMPNDRAEYSAIKKSSIIMMIYNMIEGVFSILLQEIFDCVIQNSNNMEKYPNHFHLIVSEYHLKDINSDAKKLLEFKNRAKMTIPEYNECKKHIEFYSGNLDAKKIRKVANKFGVVKIIEEETDTKLVFVKNTRNDLAHGKSSYGEATRDKTSKEIKEIKDAAVDLLYRVIEAFEKVYL